MDIGELSQPHGKDARGGSERKKRRFADRSVKSFVKRQKAAASGIRELLGVGELMLSFKMRGESPTQRLSGF